MRTLLLDPKTWDLTRDSSGNIAAAANPYAIAQDVASTGRLFLGELWYDTAQGLPYFQSVLGQRPAAGFLRAKLMGAGLTVPETVAIKVELDPLGPTRELTGKLRITDTRGRVTTVVAQAGVPWYVNAATPEAFT